MLLGLHLLTSEDLLDDALLINNKGSANGAHGLLAIHILLTPGAHRLQELVVDVSNQGERQLMLLLELHMRGGRVLAHANHLIALALQLILMVAQTASLSGAPARIVLRIEIQHQLTALIITQTDVTSLFVLAQNLGRLVSNVHVRFI